jgi:hypothetical protein
MLRAAEKIFPQHFNRYYFEDSFFKIDENLDEKILKELIKYYNENNPSNKDIIDENDIYSVDRSKQVIRKLRLFFHPDKSKDLTPREGIERVEHMKTLNRMKGIEGKILGDKFSNIKPNSRTVRIISHAIDQLVRYALIDGLFALILIKNKDLSEEKCMGIYIGLAILVYLSFPILMFPLKLTLTSKKNEEVIEKLYGNKEEGKLKYDLFLICKAQGKKALYAALITYIIYHSILLSTILTLGNLEILEKEICNKVAITIGSFFLTAFINTCLKSIGKDPNKIADDLFKAEDELINNVNEKVIGLEDERTREMTCLAYRWLIMPFIRAAFIENSTINTIVAHARVSSLFEENKTAAPLAI